MKNLKAYAAGGWFGENQERSLNTLETILQDTPYIDPYFPRHDGVKLKPGELHEPSMRKVVFDDNVQNIANSDLVVAVLDSRDGSYDTGTLWECGYAMSIDKPIIVYDPGHRVPEDLAGICEGFYCICGSEEELIYTLARYCVLSMSSICDKAPERVLFIGPDSTEEQREINTDLISSVIVECHGSSFRWMDNLAYPCIYSELESLLEGIDYIVAVIDDRHPIVSWLMGIAYQRGIPVVTYTNYDYGVNIMLLASLHYHCKGKEELKGIIQKMKRDGIYSLPKFDDSRMKAQ